MVEKSGKPDNKEHLFICFQSKYINLQEVTKLPRNKLIVNVTRNYSIVEPFGKTYCCSGIDSRHVNVSYSQKIILDERKF